MLKILRLLLVGRKELFNNNGRLALVKTKTTTRGTQSIMANTVPLIFSTTIKLYCKSLASLKGKIYIYILSLHFCIALPHLEVYSCFEKGCLTNEEKRTRQCRKWLWVIRILRWLELKVFKRVEGNSSNPCIHNFSFLLACHREPQSISAKLLLPVIQIGIVAYAFTL